MVRMRLYDAQRELPLAIESESESGATVEAFLAWYDAHSAVVEENLLRYGAVLFRGFGVATPSAFSRFLRGVAADLLDYTDGNSPRRKLTRGIYTSTEYPAQYFISLHNELSYSHRWPGRLFFACMVAPDQGGETPIADSRSILRNMNPAIVEEFTRKQIKYIRNLHGGKGFGPSWQETFEAANQSRVEQFCRESGVDFRWGDDGSLWLSQVRPAVATHPRTGEQVWFNQADQFHPSTHPKEIYEAMMSVYERNESQLPQNACFGDESPISRWMLDEIRETVRSHAVLFPWHSGDVLMVDNMLVCHGRMPFVGPRKILVAMC